MWAANCEKRSAFELAQQVERILNPRTTSLQLRGVEQSAEAD
jgi:hypothetical protein